MLYRFCSARLKDMFCLDCMKLEKILFLDVETVSQVKSYSELNENMATLWNEKYDQIKKRSLYKYEEESDALSSLPDMGLFAEFGKIICISVGFLYKQTEEDEKWSFRVRSITSDNENVILQQFIELLQDVVKKEFLVCGHNIKEFDVPYIARRLIINNIPLPKFFLKLKGKPWNNPLLDTMDLWKFGDYKHYTSLNLLCETLGIKSPKEEMSGKDVYQIYYQDHNLDRIAYYCENDVIATAQVYLKLNGKKIIEETNIERVYSLESKGKSQQNKITPL